MSLRDNNPGGAGSTHSGASILAAAGAAASANQVTEDEVHEQQRVARRAELLRKNLPILAASQSSMIGELAAAPGGEDGNDDDMMRAALDAMSAVDKQNSVKLLSTLSKDQQRGLAANMNPLQRDAFLAAGWKVPQDQQGGNSGVKGWIGRAMGGVLGPLGPAMPGNVAEKVGDFGVGALAKGAQAFGAATKLPIVDPALRAMGWVAEETSRTQRVAPLMDSGARLQEQTGMSQEEIQAQTGIDTYGADGTHMLGGVAGRISATMGGSAMNPLSLIEHPQDIWKGVQTWREIGHNGKDDFLPEVQYGVYNDLAQEFEGNPEFDGKAKDLLRYAKAFSKGTTPEELAADEGLQGDAAMQFVQKVSLLKESSDPFRKAMAKLEGGRVSYGRTMARQLWDDPTKNVSTGPNKVLSGGFDAVFSVEADPTMVVGKLSKAVKAAEWGVKGAEGLEKINRWQQGVKILEGLDKAKGTAGYAAMAKTAAANLEEAVGKKYLRSAVSEIEAVHRPAKAVSEAFQTGDYGKLVRQYPGMARSIDDMQKYDTALKGAGLPGLGDDASQVFEFYKEAARHKNLMNPEGVPTDFSTKLFGHDGGGHLVVPHTTVTQKAALSAKETVKRIAFGNLDVIHPSAVGDLKASFDEAAGDIARESGATDQEIAEQAAKMEVNKWTGEYAVKQPTRIQKKLDAFYTMVAKQVPHGWVPVEGSDALPEFMKYNDALGLIEGASPLTRADRLNRFANGNVQERQMLVREMFGKMADAAGLTSTTEGQELIKKYAHASNQIYGMGDELTQIDNGISNVVHVANRENQLAEGIAIPSMREMVIAQKGLVGQHTFLGGVRKSHVESAMTRVWKPGVVMRMGFPLRAGFDEAIQYMGRTSLREYLNTAVLEKWAGINNWELEGGQAISQGGQGAFKPIRSFTRALSTIAGGTDEAIARKAFDELAQTTDFIKAARPVQEEMLAKVVAERGRKELSWFPKTFRAVDDMAWHTTALSSEAFHKIARTKYVTREHWANALLEHQAGYAKTVRNRMLASVHPQIEQSQAEVLGHTFAGLRTGDEHLPGMEVIQDSTSPSGWRSVPVVTDRGSYTWVGHDDLSGMYLNMSHQMQSMAKAPSTRAGMQEMTHFVPQGVIDEVAGELDGIDAVKELRDRIAEDPMVRGQLAHAVQSEASTQSILASLEANGVDAETIARYGDILYQWDNWSPRTKYLLTDSGLRTDRLTNDFNVVQDRAVNAIYNAFRRADNQSNVRAMIRTQTVGGKSVARPLQRNHTRVYAPMVDRQTADAMVEVFQNPDKAALFAQSLEGHLKSRNLFGEFHTVWQGAPPAEQGYDLATWLAGVKGSIAQGDGNYMTAMMAGSTNYETASAMRDALLDVLPDSTLAPTVGFYDHANDLFGQPQGMKMLSGSTVGMAPHQALKMEAIDPDAAVRQLHIRLADGSDRWVADNELSKYGRVARMDKVESERVNYARRMVEYKKADSKVVFHSNLIDDDYKNGMTFLKGEGGHFETKKASWGWQDPEMAQKAEQMRGVLDSLGLADKTGLTLEDMVGLYKTKALRSGQLPLEGQLRDNNLWADFEELAKGAKSGGKGRVVDSWTDDLTVKQSKVVKRALDEMGINPDELGLTRSQYKTLMIEREKAHAALDPAGFGRSTALSRESIEREKDALSIAFQRAKVDPDAGLRRQAQGLRDRIADATDAGDEALVKSLTDELDKMPTPTVDRIKIAIGKEKEDYKILGEIWSSGTTEEAALRRTAQDNLREINNLFVGKQTGEPLHEVLGPLLRDQFEMDDLIRKVPLDELPAKAFGPKRLVGAKQSYDNFVGRFFQGYAEPAIGAISRMPMWNNAFDKSMETFSHVYANQIHQGLDAAGKGLLSKLDVSPEKMDDINHLVMRKLKSDPKFGEGIIDPATDYARALSSGDLGTARTHLSELAGDKAKTLTDDEMKTLANWHSMHAGAMDAQVEVAAKRANEMVIPFIDDYRLRSNLQEMIGPVIAPFYYAEEQFLKRWAKGLYETPEMLRKAQLTMNGFRNIGVVRKDPHGNEIFVVPGSELLMQQVANVATLLTGNEAYQVLDQPLSMRTDFVLPGWGKGQSRWGWGPLIGLTRDKVGERYPELGWQDERNVGKGAWEYLVPSAVSGAYKAFLRDPDANQIDSAQVSVVGMLEASGKGLPENASASDKEAYLERVRDATRAVGVLRYVTGQVGFTSMTPIDQSAMFSAEFTDMLGEGMDYEQAVNTFMERHKDMDNALVYTMFKSHNLTGAPLSETSDAYLFMRENEDVIRDHPASAAWLLPQDGGDNKFDRRAYNEQLALGMRAKRSPQEFLDQIYIKQASEDYFAKKDAYDAERRALVLKRDALKGPAKTAANEEIKTRDAVWKSEKDGYMAQHPVFAESFSPEASKRRKQTVDDLEWMIAAGIGGDQGKAIEPLLSTYIEFRDKYASLADQSSKAAKKIKDETFDEYYTKMWGMVQNDSKLQPFWNSIIKPELPDQINAIEDAKLTPKPGA